MAKRPSAWADTRFNVTMVSTTPKIFDLAGSLLDTDRLTCVRVIGQLAFGPSSLSNQVDIQMSLDVGIGVVSQRAFDAGVTAVPIPGIQDEQPESGWLYRTQVVYWKEHASGSTGEIMIPAVWHFDIRAARKIDRGVLYLALEANPAVGTAENGHVQGLIRALILT